MMWHQHYIALWHEAREHHDLILMVLVILDAVGGVSSRMADRFKIAEGGQAVLFWAALIGFLIFNDLYVEDIYFWRLVDVSELGALREADFMGEAIDYFRIGSVILCGLLAVRTRRPFFLWLALGYMGNAGSVVWLLQSLWKKQNSVVPRMA